MYTSNNYTCKRHGKTEENKYSKINAVVDMTIIIIVVSGSFLCKIFRSYSLYFLGPMAVTTIAQSSYISLPGLVIVCKWSLETDGPITNWQSIDTGNIWYGHNTKTKEKTQHRKLKR